MKEQNREITEIELMAIDIDKLFYEAEIKQTLPKKHPSIVKAEALYNEGYRKQSEVIDEFVKRLLDAFPEANRDNRCPAIYFDDYRYIIEELAEEMKGGAE